MRLADLLRGRIDRETRRDVARVALQTFAASAATYAAMSALAWPHVSWAVISAIFVIQLNSDTSILAGIGRVGGTLLGSLFGLAAAFLLLDQDAVVLRVALATAIAAAIATIWPRLSYGAVAAAAITVQPNPDLADAIQQALAISLGAVVGTLATLLVWPELGRDRVLRMLEFGLNDCSRYLQHVLGENEEKVGDRREEIHAAFVEHLGTARSVLGDSKIRVKLETGQPLRRILQAVERLWYALVLLDRAIRHEAIDILREDRDTLQGHVTTTQREACVYIDAMVKYLQTGEKPPPIAPLRDVLAQARDAAEESLRGAEDGETHGRTVRVLLFALEEVAENLIELRALLVNSEAAGED